MVRTLSALAFSLLCAADAAGHDPCGQAVPLNDLGPGCYAGFEGGLHDYGLNMPPGHWRVAGLQQAARVLPLDAQGQPARQSGRIGLLLLGAGSTRLVAESLCQLAAADGERGAAVVPVNGAAGVSIRKLAAGSDRTWGLLPELLAGAGLTAEQVQVVWLDATSGLVAQSFPDNARLLQE
ncbi:MAG TPA: hypothetical protein VFD43_02440, partial [Planctomycetota bacterium]|nr:hypothetical protein [Planctomycetota bacterium]